METTEVVEAIRTDAAVTAAREVAVTNADATLVVAENVAQVEAVLEEHAEVSEERHEEILGDTAWLRNQLELLSMNSSTILTTLGAMQSSMTTELQALRAAIESTDIPPSIPTPGTVIAVVDPPEPVVVEDPPEVVTETPKRRRLRVI